MAILRKDRFKDKEYVDITNGPKDPSNYDNSKIVDGKWQIAKLVKPPNSNPEFVSGMDYVLYVGKVLKSGVKLDAVSAPNPPFVNDDSIG